MITSEQAYAQASRILDLRKEVAAAKWRLKSVEKELDTSEKDFISSAVDNQLVLPFTANTINPQNQERAE